MDCPVTKEDTWRWHKRYVYGGRLTGAIQWQWDEQVPPQTVWWDWVSRCTSVASNASGTLLESSSWVGTSSVWCSDPPQASQGKGSSDTIRPHLLALLLAWPAPPATLVHVRNSSLLPTTPARLAPAYRRESAFCWFTRAFLPQACAACSLALARFLGTRGAFQGQGVFCPFL